MKINKRGFTLIELLAVIMILAIIALVATPIILDVIEDAKKSAAISSGSNYISAINIRLLNGVMNDNFRLNDGTYNISDLDLEINGEYPKYGTIVIKDNSIANAKFCMNNYSLYYKDAIEIVENNYCTENFIVTLEVDNNKISNEVGGNSNTTFDLSGINLTTLESVSCNNDAVPVLENDVLTVENVYGDTNCKIGRLDTVDNELDNTNIYILVLNDVSVNENIDFNNERDVIIDIGNNVINLNGKYLRTFGDLIINGSNDSKIISTGQVVNNSGSGVVTINGGYYERTAGTGTTIYNEGTGTIILNDATVKNSSTGSCLQNGLKSLQQSRSIIINSGFFESSGITLVNHYGDFRISGGVFISKTEKAFINSSNANITQKDRPIYMTSLAQEWKPVIYNAASMNINGAKADVCSNNYTQTTNGICIYAEGDKNFESDTSNTAVATLSASTTNINGGTYYGGYAAISNHYDGTVNILNSEIKADNIGIFYLRESITNVCNTKISSSKYDIKSHSSLTTGQLSYSSNVVFTNGTNTPTMGEDTKNVNSDYSGNCISN